MRPFGIGRVMRGMQWKSRAGARRYGSRYALRASAMSRPKRRSIGGVIVMRRALANGISKPTTSGASGHVRTAHCVSVEPAA